MDDQSRQITDVLGSVRDEFGQTLVHALSVSDESLCMLVRVLDAGVDVDVRDRLGRTALCVASSRGAVLAVECLLSRGASVTLSDECDFTPLHFAVCSVSDNWEMIARSLLEVGAAVDVEDKYGFTPLEMAEYRGRVEFKQLVKRILRHGDGLVGRGVT